MPENKSERLAALADQCVQCGLCLPVCPTYALDGNEAESPRGRIAIAAALARGLAPVTAELREPLDHCLGCLSCERVCPAQVRFGELLVETRAVLGPAPRRPRLLLAMAKRPSWLRLVHRLARWLGLSRWHRQLARRLPGRSALRAALGIASVSTGGPARKPFAAAAAGARLAMFPGCMASIEDADAQQAAMRLLAAAGHAVALLPSFCCGALDAHGGEARASTQAMQRVRKAWQGSGAEGLVTVTPGCLGQLRAALPGVTVSDPYHLLGVAGTALRFRPLPMRVALHLPCTQLNLARSSEVLLALLHRVPGLEVVPLPPRCCGAAGSHLLEFPERAARLREATLESIEMLAPQSVLSSNIGCRLHLAAGMAERGRAVPTMHPLVLLAQQLIEGNSP
ncbi:MAG TPA: (Fe-S)-binding protein [Frateuria sp.]|uniref:(Fe-S)-binding protein n=1 Tax=Frateuria sp. TaxID=2211372 RepID=UPI002DF68515|nr:(Fe-S)-binding protein [Frateuria sp.]